MTTHRRPPGRYDERRPLPRAVLVPAAVGFGLLLVGVTYLAFDRFSGSRVQFATLGYTVVSDTEVEVRFEVHKDLTEVVRCQVQARDRDGAVIGSAVVQIGPADREAVKARHRLTTMRRAATGEVTGCATAPPTATP